MQLSAQRVDTRLRSIFYDVADIHDECVAFYLTHVRSIQCRCAVRDACHLFHSGN